MVKLELREARKKEGEVIYDNSKLYRDMGFHICRFANDRLMSLNNDFHGN